MNDQQQPPYGPGPYDPYNGGPRVVGYDAYGRPVYEQPGDEQQGYGYGYDTGQQPTVPGQDPAAGAGSGQPYGYGPYGQQPGAQGQPQQGRPPGYGDPYGQQQGYGYGGYGQAGDYGTGQQPAAVDTTQQWNIPQQQQQQQQQQQPPQQHGTGQREFPDQAGADTGSRAAVPGQRPAPEQEYRTEQFSFIEEPDDDSEDVIDWLKFTESRSERREEARRRGKHRFVALLVVLAVVVVGGAGYLWYAGKLPGVGATAKKQSAASGGPQKRDVIVVHLHNTADKSTSTALLVNNETTGEGSTVLLPNSLAVTNDDGTVTTLGKSVDEDGSDGTRTALGNLLGTKVAGTWRLDTPYLENLVDLVGNIGVTTDTDVPDTKKGTAPLVHKGADQTLSGKAAVAYATYRAPGESDDKQLERFGEVMQATLRKMSSDPKAATVTVQTLAQILDPSLTDSDLGAALAKLADHAKKDRYKTVVLPVGTDGQLDSRGESEVKQILGGSVKASDPSGFLRVGVKNATGGKSATETARVKLVNAGYTVVDSGTGATAASSSVTYADPKEKAKAAGVAKTLGLPAGAVRKGSAGNADVAVVLGEDFKQKLG